MAEPRQSAGTQPGLLDLPLHELGALVHRREVSSREATQTCLSAIERLQPALNAFIHVEAGAALAQADAADREIAQGRIRGPLHGVPLAHKDVFFRRGRRSTCGSKIREEFRPEVTAAVIERLDAAGAVDLGGLNLAEFCVGPTGHNDHFGHCRNPWNTDHVSGGSSSGSAAAVAARLIFGSLGSDTGGSRRLDSYVMENVLFKAAYPGVVHAQTALEAAIRLHPEVAGRLDDVERIDLWSYAKAIRITSKSGALHNPADRDHCLQYMAAVGLLRGNLVEADFSDAAGADPRIDALRAKMFVHEDPRFTAGNLDPDIRSSANGIQVTFRDGTATRRIDIEQPLGHASRSAEGLPHLENKLRRNLAARLAPKQADAVMDIFADRDRHQRMRVNDFVELLVL